MGNFLKKIRKCKFLEDKAREAIKQLINKINEKNIKLKKNT